MKKIYLIILASLILLASCKENSDTKEKTNDNFTKVISTEEQTTQENDIAIQESNNETNYTPMTVKEIIEFVDALNIDTSLTTFTMDNVFPETQLSKSEDAGNDYQYSTAFLGDSVTLGLSFFKNHPSEMVIAKGSINPLDAVDKKLIETTDGEKINFPDALKLTGAKRAVLTFGSNAISIMSEETFLNYYLKLIDEIKTKTPDCQIIIQSITPLATTCTLKKLTNELINRANLLLLTLAYEHNLYFLNSAPMLKDENGYLKLEYCSSDDGIHINQSGYEIWINELRTHPIKE